jgi:excisionase family DNA binding protein
MSLDDDFKSNYVRDSPWLTAGEAAERARCGVKTIYREVQAKRLRAARIGGRRELRFLREWVDAWLLERTNVREPLTRASGGGERR